MLIQTLNDEFRFSYTCTLLGLELKVRRHRFGPYGLGLSGLDYITSPNHRQQHYCVVAASAADNITFASAALASLNWVCSESLSAFNDVKRSFNSLLTVSNCDLHTIKVHHLISSLITQCVSVCVYMCLQLSNQVSRPAT